MTVEHQPAPRVTDNSPKPGDPPQDVTQDPGVDLSGVSVVDDAGEPFGGETLVEEL